MSHRLSTYLLPKIEETGEALGNGSYGEVTELKLPNGTIVAGKRIHDVFFLSSNDSDSIESMKKRFEQECLR